MCKSSGVAVQLQLLLILFINSRLWPRSVLNTIRVWVGRVVRVGEEKCVKGFGRDIAGRIQSARYSSVRMILKLAF